MNASLKYFFLFCTSFVLSVFLFNSVNAYTVFGKKWQNANPNYYIDSSFSSQGPGWSSSANNAASSWSAVSGTPLNFYAGGGGAGNNHIQGGDPSCSTNNPPCYAGTLRGESTNYLTSFTVIVNIYDGYAYYDGTQGPSIPSNYLDLASLLRHELGHAIGLCHTAAPGKLMSAGLATGINFPVDLDAKRGDRYIYSSTYTGPGPTGPCL